MCVSSNRALRAYSLDEEKTVASVVPQSAPQQQPPSFPDGGRQAWLTVLGGFFALFTSFGFLNCVGVFQDYYQSNQLSEYSPDTIGWINSFLIFEMFFLGAPIGRLFDAFGPRYLLLAASITEVFALFMVSLCKEYYQFFLAQGVLVGASAATIFYCASNSVNTWFLKKRGIALGIVVSGSSIGGVLLPIMISKLLQQTSFAWTVRAVAFLFLGCLVIANLTITSRLKPKGTLKGSTWIQFKAFKEPVYGLVSLGVFFSMWGLFSPFTFIPSFAAANGFSYSLSIYAISILNATSVFGRVLPGLIADKFGRYNVLCIAIISSTIALLAIWIPVKSHAGILAFSAVYGFTSGAFVSLMPACVAEISDVREIGVRFGTMTAFGSFAALTGVPIAGALITNDHGSYTELQIFSGVVMAVGATFLVSARFVLAKQRKTQKL